MDELTNQSEEVTQDTQEATQKATTEQTTQQEETTTQELPKIKVKYNHEEKEIPHEEAVQLAQKGLNYDKAVERAKQEARDAYIADQGYIWQGKKITTEADYKQAMKEKEIYDSLQSKELPEEVINEIIESRKLREEIQTERQTKAQQDKEVADYQAFMKAYPDVKPEDIPQAVWHEHNQGKSLVDAYRGHENAMLRAELAELKKGQQAAEANQANANTSTGSVTGQGAATGQAYFTKEQVEKMSTEEVMKNYNAVIESRKLWK